MSHHPLSFGLASRRIQRSRALTPMVFSALMAVGWAGTAQGQGLLDIGPTFVEEMTVPFSGSVSSSIGWDSDPGAGPSTSGVSGADRGPEQERGESIVWQNSIDLAYDVKMRGRNRLGFRGSYTNLFYFEPPAGGDDMDHNGQFVMDFSREISRSLTLSDSMYLSYETEPNYEIGVAVNSGNTGYFLGSNRLSADYRWNRRFSTVTGYTISSILYDEETLDAESYVRHQLSQQFRYTFKRRLVGTFTYRYGMTLYDTNDTGDYFSHSALAGADYAWNRRLSVSAAAGVEYRTYDDGTLDDELAPRVEASFNYILAKRTSARWVHSLSLDDSGRAGAQSGYAYRTSLALQHTLTRRLGTSLSLNYIHQEYGDSPEGLPDTTEDTFYASLALNYRLWKSWSLTGNYSYTVVSSDDEFSEYERHRIFFGVSYVF